MRRSELKTRAEDVLTGRAQARAGDILDLIQAINPTGRGFPTAESKRRYELKARLQSLLVRRFTEDVEVAKDPAAPRCVRLCHRPSRREACHALLETLDEDARSWVQRRLDEETAALPDSVGGIRVSDPPASGIASPALRPAVSRPPPAHEPAGRPLSDRPAAEVLQMGQEASAAYDYETAARCFRAALADSHTAAQAGHALVVLLVEHLGADSEALDLLPSLSAKALVVGETRLLLALAAARAGQQELAVSLVKGEGERSRTAQVFIQLARRALKADDADQAEAHLVEAAMRDPVSAEVLLLREEVSRRRADARRPLEKEVQALWDRGACEAAEERARAYLGRFPDGPVFGRILRAAQDRRNAARAAHLLAQGQRARSQGHLEAAAQALREGLAADGPEALREALRSELGAVETAQHSAAREAAVAGVCAQLAADRSAGLLSYLALDPAGRAQVQERAGLQQLGWLEEAHQGQLSQRAAVAAVIALCSAQQVAHADPEAALELLLPHRKGVEAVAAGRQLLRDLPRRLLERRREASRVAFLSLQAGLAAGTVVPAQLATLCAGLDRALLSAEERHALDRMLAAAQVTAEQARFREQVQRLIAAGAVLQARELLTERLRGPAGGLPNLRSLCEEVDAAVQAQFLVCESEDEGPEDELCDVEPKHGSTRVIEQQVLPGGNQILLARSGGRQVFLRLVDLGTLRVARRLVLRTPEPMFLERTVVHEDFVWLLGGRGAVLQLSLPELRVRRFRVLDDSLPLDVRLLGPQICPEGRYFWATGRQLGDDVWVFDLDQPQVRRHIGSRPWAVPLLYRGAPVMCCPRGSALILHSPQGKVLQEIRLPPAHQPEAVAPHPAGPGLLVVTSTGPKDQHRREQLCWIEVGEDGRVGKPGVIAALDRAVRCSLLTLPGSGLSFLDVSDKDDGRASYPEGPWPKLFTLEPGPGELHVRHETSVPTGTWLSQSPGGKSAVALCKRWHGLDAGPLGPEPPTLRDESIPTDILERGLFLPLVGACKWCESWGRSDEGDAIREKLLVQTQSQRGLTIRAYWHAHQDDPERLLQMSGVLRDYKNHPESNRFWAALCQRHRTHPEVNLAWVYARASDGDWQGAMKLMGDSVPETLNAMQAQHWHHMRAMALLFTENGQGALEELEKADALGTDCSQIRTLLHLVRPLPETLTDADWGPGQPWLQQLHGAVRVADECLARADADGALRAVDRRVVWFMWEVQSLARLAEAHLLREPRCGAEVFRKRLALSVFAERNAEARKYMRREFPCPGRYWPRERLDEIAERARRWLDAG